MRLTFHLRPVVLLDERPGAAGRVGAPDAPRKPLLFGGVLGPAAFVAAWAILGLTASGYSPVDDAISRLGAVGAPTRPAMTAGFVAYGMGLVLFGMALRSILPGGAWASAIVTGVAAWGVAAFPLGSAAGDPLHDAFAVLGYLSLLSVPLLAAPELARNHHRRWAACSVAVGIVSGACLLATAIDPVHGLSQRAGLTIADAWVIAFAIALLLGRPGALPDRRTSCGNLVRAHEPDGRRGGRPVPSSRDPAVPD
jgi:hypothetical membrane protein